MKSLDSILSGASENAIAAASSASEPVTRDAPSAEPSPQPEAKPAASAQPTGDAAPKEPTGAATPPAPTEGAEPATVPLKALHEERAKTKRYTEAVESFEKKLADQNTAWERRFEQLLGVMRAPQQPQQPQNAQPPAPEVDFFADPKAFTQAEIKAALEQALGPVTATQQQLTERMSRAFAVQSHGAEVTQAAHDALEAHIAANPQAALADYQRIMASPDPWGELVTWHRNQAALKEIGNDPAAYRARLKAELLAELQGQGAQPAPAAPAIPAPAAAAAQASPAAPAAPAPVLPTNLAAARNAGTRTGPDWGGPKPLQDIFDRAQKKTRAA